ncbi:MAG: hypothetical protein GX354_10515, partial [Firmicutes bacterium]|nr:hypothetical protein [Bacillota bacterium]
ESTWQATERDEIQANCLYLTDVHNQGDSFVEATLEGKYKRTWQKDTWLFSVVPMLRGKASTGRPTPGTSAAAIASNARGAYRGNPLRI